MPKYIPCKYTYASKYSKCDKLLHHKNKTLEQNILNNNTVTSRAQLIHNMFSKGKQHTTYENATHNLVNRHFGNTYNTGNVLVNRPFGTSELK
jgi:hypothetical protein